MAVEKSAGVVIFREENQERFFLLLHYEGGHWGFPKGHIEEGENLKETAIRETKEETGIDELEFKDEFKDWIKYFYRRDNEKHFKVVTCLLAQTTQKQVEVSHEHTGYKWLNFKKALEQLTFDNTKQILKEAKQFLKGRDNNSK